MPYYPSCLVPDVNIGPNCEPELGRVRAVAFVHRNYFNTIISDVTNLTNWDIGRSAQRIFVYPETQGEFNGGDPINVRGFGSMEEFPLLYNFQLKISEPNYKGNRDHWNALIGNRNYHVFWQTETIMYASTRPVVIVPKNPHSNSLKDEVVWVAEIQWTDNKFPFEFDRDNNVMSWSYTFVPPPYYSFDDSFDNSYQ